MSDYSAAPAAPEIIKADRTYRDLVYLLYVTIILTAILFVRYAFPAVRAHFLSMSVMDLLVALRTAFVVLLMSFIPAAIYVIRVGGLVLRHDCYPYPGRKVMFDTTVVRGAKARVMGKSLVGLGVVFLALMVISVLYTLIRYTGWINDPDMRRFWGSPTATVQVVNQPSIPGPLV